MFTGDVLVGLLSLTRTGICLTSLKSTSSDPVNALLVDDDDDVKLGDRLPIFDFVGVEIPEPSDSIPPWIIADVAVADNDAEVANKDAAVEREAEDDVAEEDVDEVEDAAARRRNASVILSCRVIKSFDKLAPSLPYNSSPLKSFLSFSFNSESFSFILPPSLSFV